MAQMLPDFHSSLSLWHHDFFPPMPVIWGRSVTLIAVELSHFLHCQCCVTEWNRRISWTCWQSEILYLSSRRKHLLWVTQMLVWYLVVIDLLLPWYPFIFSRAELDLDAIGWLAQTVFWPKKIKKKREREKEGTKTISTPMGICCPVLPTATKLHLVP